MTVVGLKVPLALSDGVIVTEPESVPEPSVTVKLPDACPIVPLDGPTRL